MSYPTRKKLKHPKRRFIHCHDCSLNRRRAILSFRDRGPTANAMYGIKPNRTEKEIADILSEVVISEELGKVKCYVYYDFPFGFRAETTKRDTGENQKVARAWAEKFVEISGGCFPQIDEGKDLHGTFASEWEKEEEKRNEFFYKMEDDERESWNHKRQIMRDEEIKGREKVPVKC